MQRVNTSQHWIKLLSAFWLIVAVQFGVAQPQETNYQQVEYSEQVAHFGNSQSYDYLSQNKTCSETGDFNGSSHLHFIADVFDFRLLSEPPLTLLPDESRVTFYFKIVTYQHFKSSLFSTS